MAREKRVYSDTGMYHIIMRGVGQQVIFYDDDDRYAFLKRLAKYSGNKFIIYAYVLMDNHIHLLAYSNDISAEIKRMNISFVYWYNKKYERYGHLYQNRFLSEAIDNDRYMKQCVRYVLLNPVNAGICPRAADYEWSSYHSYFNESKGFVDVDYVEGLFKNREELDDYLSEGNRLKFIYNENWKFGGRRLEELILSKLSGKSIHEISVREKIKIARFIIEGYRVHKSHLAKLLGLPYKVVNEME